jgi:sulfur-carrier protein
MSRMSAQAAHEVIVRYWASARAATSVASEARPAGTVAEILAACQAEHPDLERVVRVASILVDGMAAGPSTPVPGGATMEVLPPFAGG